jgi:Nse4 C-terminal
VENIFHYSFLIKSGSGGIGIREADGETKHPALAVVPPGLYVQHVDTGAAKKTSKQSVVALTLSDWRRLCRAFELHQPVDAPPAEEASDEDPEEVMNASARISQRAHQSLVAVSPLAIPHRPTTHTTVSEAT